MWRSWLIDRLAGHWSCLCVVVRSANVHRDEFKTEVCVFLAEVCVCFGGVVNSCSS